MAIGKQLWKLTIDLRIPGATPSPVTFPNGDPLCKFVSVYDTATDAQARAICNAVFNFDYAKLKAIAGATCVITEMHQVLLAERNALRAAGYQVSESIRV